MHTKYLITLISSISLLISSYIYFIQADNLEFIVTKCYNPTRISFTIYNSAQASVNMNKSIIYYPFFPDNDVNMAFISLWERRIFNNDYIECAVKGDIGYDIEYESRLNKKYDIRIDNSLYYKYLWQLSVFAFISCIIYIILSF